MLRTLRTLIEGSNARADEALRNTYAIELIDQKIREAEAGLKAAKFALAGLIQKERGELRQIERIDAQLSELSNRAKLALKDGRDDLAQTAAAAIAQMENEKSVRTDTLHRLQTRVTQLRHSLERASRRLLDLKQGAIGARAVHKEQALQRRLGRHVAQDTAFEEAEELVQQVLSRDDPFEQSQILNEIDTEMRPEAATDVLAEAGFGPPTKSTAQDVLARLKAE